MIHYKYYGIAVVSTVLILSSQTASAQNVPTQNSAIQLQQNQYVYCKLRAAEISGYNGSVPDKYLPGGALEGAAKGAARAQLGGLIFGRNKKQRRKDAKRDAIIGGIAGAIKRSAAKKKLAKQARHYRLELDACMRAGGY